MVESLDNSFVVDREGRSWDRNGEDTVWERAYVRILLRLSDGQTYRMIHTDKPGSTGKGSCEQSPGEGDYQCLGLLKDAEGSTTWRRQGMAAGGQDSNKRPGKGNMPCVAHFHSHANIHVPAWPAVRTTGTVWHCSPTPGSQDPWSD